MVRRNSRSESRSQAINLNLGIVAVTGGVTGVSQLQYYNNDFGGHFKNSRAQNIKAENSAPE